MSADSGLPDGDRRGPVRLKALKSGRIVFHHGASTIDCVIRNISEGGAKIVVEQALTVPEEFDLLFEDGAVHHCIVRWRKLKELGVSFES